VRRAGYRTGRTSRALRNFEAGFNCAQSVLSVYGGRMGLDPAVGNKVSQAFGAGMSRMAWTCGAVTGALMVIGLKHGKTRAQDDAAKEKTYALSREFIRRFEARHGSLTCRELLGHHIGTARGAAIITAKDFHRQRCSKYVRDAVLILDDLL
jgi:C_GCAxxG_C_C family probable redox protein